MGIALCVFAFQARAYEPAQEIQLFEESVRAFRRTSDVWLTANVIRFLGWALLDQDIDRAKQLVQESFDLWEKMGSAHGMCAALDNLGRIALSRGEHAQAYAFFERSLSYAQETGYLELIASSLDGLSRADRQQFIEYSEQRLSELRKSGKTKDIATTLHAVGVSILDLGDYERAETIFQECLHLWKQLGGYSLRVPNVAWTLVELGHSARHRGKLHQAIAHYAEAVDASHAANGVYATTEVHFYLGYAYLLQHHYEKAEQHMRDGLINWLREMEPIVPTAALLIAAMARVAHVQGNASRSARLAGAATAHLTDSMLAEIRPIEQQDFDCLISTVRVLLENPDNAHAWAEGAALTLKQAVEYALEA
jgi:tetratricopeptide (TPR) repeat protein